MRKELSPKQKAFADFYIETGNAEQSAIKAGYSEKYARGNAHKLVANSCISEYIAKRQKEIDDERICDIAEIQRIRTAIARGERKDDFGFTPENSDILKACSDLEKSLKIKEEQEELQRQKEEALNKGIYHTDLDTIADVFHPAIRDMRKHGHREYVFPGGRGSAKSSCALEMPFEILMNNPDMHALVCRKVANTLRDSVYSQMTWGCEKQAENPMFVRENWEFKLSPLEITYLPTGQKIYFRGADDPTKIKSIKPPFGFIGVLIFEELDQFSGEEEVRKIEQSAIRGGSGAYIFKIFNPPKSANNWANKYVATPKESMLVTRSTYKDIPPEWLGDDFIEEAEHLKETNPSAYENEYMGVPNGSGGAVFEYLEFREITDEEIAGFDRICQGVDWGWYPDKYAFIRSYYNHNTETIYLIAENYVNKQSNEQTGKWIIKQGYTDYPVICDSAEHKSTNDYKDMGIPARDAIKGPGSVEYGMKWLQRRHIVIDQRRTPNAYKELSEYEYERDKEGNPISGYPDENNHLIDALRYSYEPLWGKRGSKA